MSPEKIKILPHGQLSHDEFIADLKDLLDKKKRFPMRYVVLYRIHPVYIEDTYIAVKLYTLTTGDDKY